MMTPRTRSSNPDVNSKVYCAKKVPQQALFPHRRKIMRKPQVLAREGLGKQQMVFLPEKMRANIAKSIRDSDEEDGDEDLEDDSVAIDAQTIRGEKRSAARAAPRQATKRGSDAMQLDNRREEEPFRLTTKRSRTATVARQNHRPSSNMAESEVGHPEHKVRQSRKHSLRRQSTMTQLVDGRKPRADVDEPSFRPVKRSPRVSRSGKGQSKTNDRQQRTLTQMVPGMRPLQNVSDEDVEDALSDLEAQKLESQNYDDAVAMRLARQGYFRATGDDTETTIMKLEAEEGMQPVEDFMVNITERPMHQQITPVVVAKSAKHMTNEHGEENYQPTQYIQPLNAETGHRLQRGVRVPQSIKSRFSLLSTPEKRRIYEIPSSQSPAYSPLSTQVSPDEVPRSPLEKYSVSRMAALETPSQRKHVAFTAPPTERLGPPSLRKFESTIQDSEDEDEHITEDDVPSRANRVNIHARTPINDIDESTYSKAIDIDTQIESSQIDSVTHQGRKDITGIAKCPSKESIVPLLDQYRADSSPELGEPNRRTSTLHQSADFKDLEDIQSSISLPTAELLLLAHVSSTRTDSELTHPAELPISTPLFAEACLWNTCPPTPIVIQDELLDDDSAPDLISPHQSTFRLLPATMTDSQHATSLEVESIQVPRSPSTQHDTQQSHSSKAEQQIQHEWISYSQYINVRPQQSSSMNVVHDAFSYGATQIPPHITAQKPPSIGLHFSQATTVDEATQITPRKSRTQQIAKSPYRIASSQPAISPSKPPPLFIPSSFPSPAKAEMEGWSSPMYDGTQHVFRSSQVVASLEDFSIPPPPPIDD